MGNTSSHRYLDNARDPSGTTARMARGVGVTVRPGRERRARYRPRPWWR